MSSDIDHQPLSAAIHEPSADEGRGLAIALVYPFVCHIRCVVAKLAAARLRGEEPPVVVSYFWSGGDARKAAGLVATFSTTGHSATSVVTRARHKALSQGRGLPDAVLVINSYYLDRALASEGSRLVCGALIETASGAFARTFLSIHLDAPGLQGAVTGQPAEWLAQGQPLPEAALGFYGTQDLTDASPIPIPAIRALHANPVQEAHLKRALNLDRH